MDTLSQLLRLLRLEGALFLHGRFHRPWGVAVPQSLMMAPALRPDARHLAIMHMVLEGRCWVCLEGDVPVALEAGDLAVFAHGDPHALCSEVRHATVDLGHMVDPKLPSLQGLRYGGDGEACVLACSWLSYEGDAPDPLLAALPRFFRARLGTRDSGAWLRASVGYALAQAQRDEAGAAAVSARVAESLFLEALRSYVEDLPMAGSGWLAGLRDPQVARCLALMHERPAHDWTVARLASQVHLGRSALAERFAQLTGQTPIAYLKKLRLTVASRLLCQEHLHLAQVAGAVGYDSESSFSRAFKAEFGMTPGQWRERFAVRRAGGVAGDAAAK